MSIQHIPNILRSSYAAVEAASKWESSLKNSECENLLQTESDYGKPKDCKVIKKLSQYANLIFASFGFSILAISQILPFLLKFQQGLMLEWKFAKIIYLNIYNVANTITDHRKLVFIWQNLEVSCSGGYLAKCVFFEIFS